MSFNKLRSIIKLRTQASSYGRSSKRSLLLLKGPSIFGKKGAFNMEELLGTSPGEESEGEGTSEVPLPDGGIRGFNPKLGLCIGFVLCWLNCIVDQ